MNDNVYLEAPTSISQQIEHGSNNLKGCGCSQADVEQVAEQFLEHEDRLTTHEYSFNEAAEAKLRFRGYIQDIVTLQLK